MASVTQHDDFGEKIGGARKDLWQQRGLISEDLSGMNSREADKYVTKDNVWKKPNYQAIIDRDVPVDVAYFIKTVRDSIATAPVYRRTDDTPEKRFARQIEYIDTIREIQSAVESVKSKKDVFTVFNRCMENTGYYERLEPGVSGSYYATPTEKGRSNTVLTDKLARALFIRSERDYSQKVEQMAVKEQFGVSKEDKVPKGYAIRFNDGKYTYSKNNDWQTDTYYVTKGSRIIQQNFATKEEALKWVQDYVRQRGGDGKQRFTPPQLEHVRRDGPDYRHGKDADGQIYLDTFGFRGGEFGNWMTQNDRQASLNFGYDALKDLAVALKITDKDIAYQGVLSIAFGARGIGKAVAHYETLRQVINLTKMKGAGSLAHEWWHGLDDFMGTKLGLDGMLSEIPRKHPLFEKLIETIKFKPESPEQAAARSASMYSQIKRNAESWLTAEILPSIKRNGDEKALSEYEALKDAFLSGEKGSIAKISDLKKRVTGRVIPKSTRETLLALERSLSAAAEDTEPVIWKTTTEYYSNSKEMGKVYEKDGHYWDSNTEMTARAFATYVMDRLPWRSDYLVGHAECAVSITTDKDGKPKILCAFPQGEEREAINAVFDEIIAELKLEQYLTHDDRKQAEQPPSEIVKRKPQEKPTAPAVSHSFLERLNLAKAAAAKLNSGVDRQAHANTKARTAESL